MTEAGRRRRLTLLVYGGALLILSTVLPTGTAEAPTAGVATDGGAGDGRPVADEHDVPDR